MGILRDEGSAPFPEPSSFSKTLELPLRIPNEAVTLLFQIERSDQTHDKQEEACSQGLKDHLIRGDVPVIDTAEFIEDQLHQFNAQRDEEAHEPNQERMKTPQLTAEEVGQGHQEHKIQEQIREIVHHRCMEAPLKLGHCIDGPVDGGDERDEIRLLKDLSPPEG